MGLFPDVKSLTQIAERLETKFEKEINQVEGKLQTIIDLLTDIRGRLPVSGS